MTNFDSKILQMPATDAPKQYNCPTCKDCEFIETEIEGRYRPCICRLKRITEEGIEAIEGQWPRFQELSLETYKPSNSSQEKALYLCKKFAEEWPLCKKGILLSGPVGVGKTGLLWSLAKACARKTCERPLWKTCIDVFADIRRTYDDKQKTEETEHTILDRLCSRRIFLLDDLGVEKESEWSDSILFRLLNDRYMRMLPTLISTNFSIDGDDDVSLESRIGMRLMSRLSECCHMIKIYGKDRRNK